MARQKAPCGTYSAYQRHLSERTAVDAACRRAQQVHDRGGSSSSVSRVARVAAQRAIEVPVDSAPVVPIGPTPTTAEGHVSRVEVLKEMLQESRELVTMLQRTYPARAYLAMREQREILRELSELQGNGQVKGVTLADQLADARARRVAPPSIS
jgi:hypothetical protein